MFYLTNFDLGSGSTLNIGGTPDNPTIILLHGELNTQPNCVINVTNGLPTNLLIYSDDTQDINLQPNGNFRALVYAPYADIDLKPNGDLHGVFWGRDLLLLPNNDIFIDVDLLNQFLSAHVRLEQWKQVLD